VDLKDKVALVTGAGRRVGRVIAEQLGRRGARVAVHYRTSSDEADEVVANIKKNGGEAKAFQADLCSVPDLQLMVRNVEVDLGYVDVLVNNASEFFETPLSTASDEDYDRLMDTNLKAPFRLSRRIAPTMLNRANRGSGKIINIIDVHAERYLKRHLAYCVSKAGLLMLTTGLARELAPSVQVNAVSPGTVLFPEAYDDAQRDALRKSIPLGREGVPDDVAGAVLYLVEAEYVTGEVIHVDGGRSTV